MRKTNFDVEEKILEMASNGIHGAEIARRLNMQKMTVSRVLKRYRVPEQVVNTPKKNIIDLCELISLRLLYACSDVELIAKRLESEILFQKPEKIVVSNRLQKIVNKDKINKVVDILDRVNVRYNLEYASN